MSSGRLRVGSVEQRGLRLLQLEVYAHASQPLLEFGIVLLCPR